MGLISVFTVPPSLGRTRRRSRRHVTNDRLTARVDVHNLHNLFASPLKFGKRFHLRGKSSSKLAGHIPGGVELRDLIRAHGAAYERRRGVVRQGDLHCQCRLEFVLRFCSLHHCQHGVQAHCVDFALAVLACVDKQIELRKWECGAARAECVLQTSQPTIVVIMSAATNIELIAVLVGEIHADAWRARSDACARGDNRCLLGRVWRGDLWRGGRISLLGLQTYLRSKGLPAAVGCRRTHLTRALPALRYT